MTLHKFERVITDAQGRVVKRDVRYIERRGGLATERGAPAAAHRPEAQPEIPPLIPAEEIARVKEIREDIAALEGRLRALEAAPAPSGGADTLARSQKLAGVMQEAVARLDSKMAALESRLEHMSDHEARLRKIEVALGTYAAMATAVAEEEASS